MASWPLRAATAAEANAVLARYRLDHNRRFAVAPQDCTPAWRPQRRGLDLDRACSFRYEATVLKDNSVRLGGTIVLDIPPGPRRRTDAGTRVEVRQLLDGTWRVYSGDHARRTPRASPSSQTRTGRPGHGSGARRLCRGEPVSGRPGHTRERRPGTAHVAAPRHPHETWEAHPTDERIGTFRHPTVAMTSVGSGHFH